ncbi:MAG: type II toxin-antitoxin system HicA family toxin [Clostridia bacterium]|nr:type II toxin-antitoxin system HicA family toxin [Clostridia bacterium]
MSDINKLVRKMKRQPNGIRFREIVRILEYGGYTMKTKKGTSHRQFINKNGDVITIKEDNPLKAVYVKDVLKRVGL